MEIVPFEIAKKLKEKGFKEKCLAYYDINDNVGLLYNTQYSDEYSPCQYTDLLQSHNTDTTVAQPDDSENCCDAPAISQVLKWLRKTHNLFIVVFLNDDSDNPVTFEIYKGVECVTDYHIKYYPLDEWSKAEIDAIEYVLDNLI